MAIVHQHRLPLNIPVGQPLASYFLLCSTNRPPHPQRSSFDLLVFPISLFSSSLSSSSYSSFSFYHHFSLAGFGRRREGLLPIDHKFLINFPFLIRTSFTIPLQGYLEKKSKFFEIKTLKFQSSKLKFASHPFFPPFFLSSSPDDDEVK